MSSDYNNLITKSFSTKNTKVQVICIYQTIYGIINQTLKVIKSYASAWVEVGG